jgi:uncharacterized phage protein (TIGR01671 family)
MRTVKYRLWDKIAKKMVAPNKNILINLLGKVCSEDTECGSGVLELKEETYELIQFTGLFDKNGEEIYENDIVRININGKTFLHEVTFLNGSFCLVGSDYNFLGNYVHLDLEVIGNIYENGELVKIFIK